MKTAVLLCTLLVAALAQIDYVEPPNPVDPPNTYDGLFEQLYTVPDRITSLNNRMATSERISVGFLHPIIAKDYVVQTPNEYQTFTPRVLLNCTVCTGSVTVYLNGVPQQGEEGEEGEEVDGPAVLFTSPSSVATIDELLEYPEGTETSFAAANLYIELDVYRDISTSPSAFTFTIRFEPADMNIPLDDGNIPPPTPPPAEDGGYVPEDDYELPADDPLPADYPSQTQTTHGFHSPNAAATYMNRRVGFIGWTFIASMSVVIALIICTVISMRRRRRMRGREGYAAQGQTVELTRMQGVPLEQPGGVVIQAYPGAVGLENPSVHQYPVAMQYPPAAQYPPQAGQAAQAVYYPPAASQYPPAASHYPSDQVRS